MTKVVNLLKEKYDVYIGRSSDLGVSYRDGYFGNPFRMKEESDRQKVINKYRLFFEDRIKRDPEFKSRIEDLKDKTLGCFCKPLNCHGDVIKEYLENMK